MIKIKKLPPSRWQEYRKIRLLSLKTNPEAFSSSYKETFLLPEKEWKERIKNVLFALEEDKPVGLIVYVIGKSTKTRHAVDIFSLYVKKTHRKKGIASKLMDHSLKLIKRNRRIIKVKVSVISKETNIRILFFPLMSVTDTNHALCVIVHLRPQGVNCNYYSENHCPLL